MIPASVRKYKWNVTGLLAAAVLFVSYLWQQEIVDERIASHDCYYFPFYLGGCMNVWLARDVWYGVLSFSVLLMLVSLWFWE